ncbi:RidA family protein [Streptomyces sp. NBC_01304]|uniref:RidA family protein n=1 Tax=Streptomyces sp. NBC_01304 TaxID=2903818 RepID=UPI002E13E65F|nr:RidA family protein [Streptomyces sp. NBC_01304]
MQFTLDNPSEAPQPLGPYSQVARIQLPGGGTLLQLSGQIAEGEDLAAQSHGIFVTIAALLKAHGATLDDIVNIRTYLTDITRLPEYAAVRRQFLTGTPPTSTTVEVPRLFRPEALIEVEVVAALTS